MIEQFSQEGTPTSSDNVIVTSLECLVVPQDFPCYIHGILMVKHIDAQENFHHPIEIFICDIIGKNEATERFRKIVRIKDVDIASGGSIHCGEGVIMSHQENISFS